MKTMTQKSMWTTIALLALTATAAMAFWGGGMRGQGPPQAAYDACNGKQVGESVSFQNRRGFTVEATCQQFNGTLVAMPQNWRGGSGFGAGYCAGPSGGGPGYGRGMRGGQFGQGPMAGGFGPRMAALLDLTAEQQTQIQAIREAQFATIQATRTEMWQKRSAMRDAILADNYDEAAVRKLIAEQNELRTEMILSHAKMKQEIFSLLTPEQKTRARNLMSQWGPRRGPGGGPGMR